MRRQFSSKNRRSSRLSSLDMINLGSMKLLIHPCFPYTSLTQEASEKQLSNLRLAAPKHPEPTISLDIIQQLPLVQPVFHLRIPTSASTYSQYPTDIPRRSSFQHAQLHHSAGSVGQSNRKARMFRLNWRGFPMTICRSIVYQWGVCC